MARSIVQRIKSIEDVLLDINTVVNQLAAVWIDEPDGEDRAPKTVKITGPRHRQSWTEDDEVQLMALVEDGKTYQQMGRALRRTDKACQLRVSRIRTQGRDWLS